MILLPPLILWETAYAKVEPIATKTIDKRITEGQCSLCGEPLDLANDVGSPKEQHVKLNIAFSKHNSCFELAAPFCAILLSVGVGCTTILTYLMNHPAKSDHSKIKQRASQKLMARLDMAEKMRLTVPCPTCGATTGERCKINSGQPRYESHQNRSSVAGTWGRSL